LSVTPNLILTLLEVILILALIVCVRVLGSTPGVDAVGGNRTQKHAVPPPSRPSSISCRCFPCCVRRSESEREIYLPGTATIGLYNERSKIEKLESKKAFFISSVICSL